jgi:alanyl-tRNA synthetase
MAVIERMHNHYPHLKENESSILNELEKEEIKFAKTLDKGLKELQKYTGMGIKITGKDAFYIYETYGFPIEMILEEISSSEANDPGDYSEHDVEEIMEGFNTELENHKAQSRAGAEKKFKGGLADQSERTTALHTTHHLLLAALQNTLGNHVKQRGSNITSERLRIDFLHNEKLTPETLKEVEDLVNDYIGKDLVIEKVTMPKAEAEKIGAEMEFGKNYGDLVTVYFIKDQKTGVEISKEFCGGPHVENIEQIREQGSFKILKEESSGAGIRRIKATLLNE